MKNFVVFCMILNFFCALNLYSQEPAKDEYHNRLFYLCKAWGHLKYYHPEIASGNISWDAELFRILPAAKTLNHDKYLQSLNNWILQTGSVAEPDSEAPVVIDSLTNNKEMDWIENAYFSDSVQELLHNVYDFFRPRENVYLDRSDNIHIPIFKQDSLYYNTPLYPSEELRILAVFRFWNIIYYFFPYLDIMDDSWDDALKNNLPTIVEAKDELDYHLNFKLLVNKLQDTHADNFSSQVFFNWDGLRDHPPFLAKYIEGKTVVTKTLPSAKGINVGDIIEEIEGIEIQTFRDSVRKYVCASNEAALERNITWYLMYGAPGPFSVVLNNGNNSQEYILSRTYYTIDSLLSRENLSLRDTVLNDGRRIGIVDMKYFTTDMIYKLMRELYDTEAIIFDLRGYPNGTLYEIARFLYEERPHISNIKKPDLLYPGTFYWEEGIIAFLRPFEKRYKGELLLLINEDTQSQAEYVCMGMEVYPSVTKIGSTTAGADGNVTIAFVPGQIGTVFTSIGVFYPDFTPTQRVGIIPDYFVRPTIEGVRAGKDEVMDFALQLLVTSTEEIENKKEFNIYPNPVNDILNIQILCSNPEEKCKIEICDIQGVKVLSGETKSNNAKYDLSSLNPGIYIIKFTSNEVSKIGSFIKL